MNAFKAIAAMSLNRVIGAGNRIPWHLPEDFKWFKKMTTGQVIVMGRKTFESIGKPLPNRTTIVLTRSPEPIPGVRTISDLSQLDPADPALAGREIFICGGAQLYQQACRCVRTYTSPSCSASSRATPCSRPSKINSSWPKKSSTARSSRFCTIGSVW